MNTVTWNAVCANRLLTAAKKIFDACKRKDSHLPEDQQRYASDLDARQNYVARHRETAGYEYQPVGDKLWWLP